MPELNFNFLEVTQEIKIDHDNVRDLFDRFKSSSDKAQKTAIANTLIREMAIHSDAEEVSIYNDYFSLGLGDTASHNKEQHAEVQRLVCTADSTSIDQDDYDDIMSQAVNGFLKHAAEEEEKQHPIIRQRLTQEESDRVARSFLSSRRKVSTRPHPGAPEPGSLSQKAIAVRGTLHDKLMKTLGGRQFVALKYEHPDVGAVTQNVHH